MRLTASSAIGEIGAAFLTPPSRWRRCPASSKNLRLAWLQHRRFDDRARFPIGRIKSRAEPPKAAGLEDAAPVRQMTLRMLAAAIARGVEHRRWRVLAADRAVVAHVSPDAASFQSCLSPGSEPSVSSSRAGAQPTERGVRSTCAGATSAAAQALTRSASVDRLRSTPSWA